MNKRRRDIFTILSKEWKGCGSFLGRGNFSELMFGIAEVFTGIHILIVGSRAEDTSILLSKINGEFPIRLIGVCWLLAGSLTLTGIGLYIFGYRTTSGYSIERLLRFLGSLGSIFVWLCAAIILSPSPFAYIYYMAAIASMRITRIVWHK